MRTALTIIGIFTAVLTVFGSLFKIQHYPGGGMMLILGVSLFAFPFLILLLIHRIINRQTGLDLAEGIAKVVTLWFLSIGTLFLVQHYPGGGILNIFGMQLLGFVYLPLLLIRFYMEKDFRKSISLVTLAIALGGFSMTLAYRSSKSILEMFVRNEGMIQQVTLPMLKLDSRINASPKSGSYPELEKTHRDAKRVCDSIKAYEHHLIRKCEGMPPGTPDSLTRLSRSSQVSNYDQPTRILVGADPASPRKGKWSAHRLKKMLQGYRDRLIDRAKSEAVRQRLRQRMNYKVDPSAYRRKQTWETIYFYHVPLAGVVNTLSTLRSNVLASAQVVMSDIRRTKPDSSRASR